MNPMFMVVEVFWSNILPIFLLAGMGAVLAHFGDIEIKPLAKVSLYVLSPCLVFDSLSESSMPVSEILSLAMAAACSIVVMGLFGVLVGWVFRLSRSEKIAVILVLAFANVGNYGLTLCHIRYGEPGLARAVVFFVVSTVITFSVGIWVASLGKSSWRRAGLKVLRLPPIYAVMGAALVNYLDITVPTPISTTIHIAGEGSIPVMLLVLGMSIASMKNWRGWRIAVLLSLGRLIGGAAVGLAMSVLFGLSGVSRSVMIIDASMPTAVIATILAAEFEIEVSVVTATVVSSTCLSPLLLALLIGYLGL